MDKVLEDFIKKLSRQNHAFFPFKESSMWHFIFIDLEGNFCDYTFMEEKTASQFLKGYKKHAFEGYVVEEFSTNLK